MLFRHRQLLRRGLLGLTGIATLAQARTRAEFPLAAVPLIFAAQQAVEGALWLTVPEGREHSVSLANAFLVFALVLWPVHVPIAHSLAERDSLRRLVMLIMAPAGIGVAAYSAGTMLAHPYRAWPVGHSLTYVNNHPYSPTMAVLYLACTCLPPLISSSRAINLYGVFLAAGLGVALLAYYESFVSVWCFVAALASFMIFRFFRARRIALAPAS